MDERFTDHESRPDGVSLHQIVIEQIMTESGDVIDWMLAEDVEGDRIPLGVALGMLRLAEDTLLHPAESEERP